MAGADHPISVGIAPVQAAVASARWTVAAPSEIGPGSKRPITWWRAPAMARAVEATSAIRTARGQLAERLSRLRLVHPLLYWQLH